jgi:dUTP pyrophosphatase
MENSLKIFSEYGYLPKFETSSSACFDIPIFDSLGFSTFLFPGKVVPVPTGLYFEIPPGYHIQVFIRSSMAKAGIILANSVGIIDEDYRDELKLLLINTTNETIWIENSKRVAQGMLVKTLFYSIEALESLPARLDSRTGGFGSTGK